MRTPSYDPAALEAEIGPRGNATVNSGNRDKVQNWLVSQGVPSVRVKTMKIATLWKCYNKPKYLAAIRAHLGDSSGIVASNPSGADFDDAAADLACDPVSVGDRDAAVAPPAIPLPAPIAPVAAASAYPTDAAGMLTQAIQAIAAGAINEARVIELIAEYAPLFGPAPKTHDIVIVAADGERRNVGRQHRQFETLLKACSARDHRGHRLNIWLAGPAGSGKTTAAENVATALGLAFYFNGAIDNEYKLLGFTDAQGRIVSRPFRQAYENGGVYLFDEIDGSLPGALLAFNAATANGQCDFPDGMIRRHPDCVIIAAANTYGQGATAQFVGRMKQDGAFLDRFAMLPWEIDEGLERDLCPDSDWCALVQRVRGRVVETGLQVIVSPRASFYGASLLAAGLDRETVIGMALRKGMSAEQWRAVGSA